MPSASPASASRQFWAMNRAYVRGVKHRIETAIRTSRLMVLTLVGFLVFYLIAGYFLFAKGLDYVYNTPIIGALLVERIVFLVFFFFFVMLAFSNAVIAYMSLFRSKETSWQLTLPIRHHTLVLWKVVEALIVSSWGLVVLSAPFIVAFGTMNGADLGFYFKSFGIIIPFIATPACLGAWVLLLLIRFYKHWMRWFLTTLLIVGTAILIAEGSFEDPQGDAMDVSSGVDAILDHTKITVNPWVPSTWVSEAIVSWMNGIDQNAGGTSAGGSFYFLVTLSWALMGLFITHILGSFLFYDAWNACIRRTASARRKRRERAVPQKRSTFSMGLKRSTWALMVKDVRTFVRDPGQWGQFLIVFALLFIYVFNLRNMGYDYASYQRLTIIAYLNLTVCSLALSTLTTRFIFPQFSLEGRRLWLLGLAPFGLNKVIQQKFALSVIFTGFLTMSLITVSGIKLRLTWDQITFFSAAIGIMSFGLNALAIGLGTLFPNPKESNPAKIVSGFGGTLCLILSFVYIVVSIIVLALPQFVRLSRSSWIPHQSAPWVALTILVAVTGIFSFFSLILAIRKTKRLELLGI